MRMKRFFAKKWVQVCLMHLGVISIAAALIALISWIFGSACPTYALFSFCCPFCGMTRAHLAALRLDFTEAFSYHPAFFAGLPFLWLTIHKRLFEKKWQSVLWWILTLTLGALLLGTYVARVIVTGGFDFFA